MARAGKSKSSKKKSPAIRWLRRLAWLAFIVLLLPYALALLYMIPAIKPVSTLMLADTVSGQSYERDWVDYDDIAPVLVRSVMMSEDGKFCAHNGIDWEALNSVVDGALSGEKTRGASTIPMQTAKNLFLWNGRSFVRKALEVPLALFIDAIWTKRRLMEIYLNIAEWGPGIYGIGAASTRHLGRPAANLSARQAALLAVTLPNPAGRNPAAPSNGLQRLARTIEGRARKSGAYITCLEE